MHENKILLNNHILGTVSGFAIIFLFSFSIMMQFSYGELYYNDDYSFSVEYPNGLNIIEADNISEDLDLFFT